jgi:peptide/nickel transport system permease protein
MVAMHAHRNAFTTMNISAVLTRPWLIWPAVFVVCFVLACNFMGDGLRDAADPYKV